MRQVGDRLIPVGVSSSRLGSELPPGATTGPGGAIIISEDARWAPGSGERRGSRSRRSELTQFLHNLGNGPDMEEVCADQFDTCMSSTQSLQVMMMEAMRLSLLEHEEEQRRQARQQSNDNQQRAQVHPPRSAHLTTSQPDTVSSTTSSTLTAPTDTTSSTSQPQRTTPRSSSLSNDLNNASTSASPLPPTAQELGISNNMMAELSELVEGGIPGVVSHSTEEPTAQDSHKTAAAHSFLQSHRHDDAATPSPTATPPTEGLGSPPRVGTNPNNPFRRMGGSNVSSPGHSRQGSTVLPTGSPWQAPDSPS